MEVMSIIEIVGGILVGGGFLELIKWLYTRKSSKEALELENEAKQQELKKQSQGTVDEWERLSAQHEKDIEYYRSMVQEKETVIENLREEVNELHLQVVQLTANVTQSQLLKCTTVGCQSRIPPFGYKKINFKTGEIEES